MSILNYFRNAVSELHRVTWSTRAQAIRITTIVLVVTFAFAFVFGFFDTFLAWGYKTLLNLSS